MNWKAAIAMAGGLVILFGFMGWSFHTAGSMRLVGASSTTSLIIIVAGVAGTGLLAGVLMGLAFYSSRKGYDEAPKFVAEDPEDEPK